MKLIVGLGNPGKEYETTRHNVGFLFLDYISDALEQDGVFVREKETKLYSYREYRVEDERIIVLKPLTYMNKSGEAVVRFLRYVSDAFSISDDLWVVHDELDIDFGSHKIQRNRSSAGHNGVQDVIDHLGTKEFGRVRIGVEGNRGRLSGQQYVLKPFSRAESKELPSLFQLVWLDLKKKLF